jgi:hypothetical protein
MCQNLRCWNEQITKHVLPGKDTVSRTIFQQHLNCPNTLLLTTIGEVAIKPVLWKLNLTSEITHTSNRRTCLFGNSYFGNFIHVRVELPESCDSVVGVVSEQSRNLSIICRSPWLSLPQSVWTGSAGPAGLGLLVFTSKYAASQFASPVWR